MARFGLYSGELLHICSLFNNVVSHSNYTAWNNQTLVNNDLDGMWKEVVMAKSKVLIPATTWRG
jgi:hypothetical protein